MKLRRATTDDVPLLEYWDTKQHVIDCGGASDDGDWRDEIIRAGDWGEIFIAEEAARPIGVLQIIDPAKEPTRYWAPHFPDGVDENLRALDIWIGEEEDLGRGYGTEMMRLALARCFEPPEVTAVLIDPLVTNKNAIRFYERLGFVHDGVQTFEGDKCAVMRMTREARAADRPRPGN